MQPEDFLKWIDGTPLTRPYQMYMLIGITYREALGIEKVLKEQGYKLDEETLLAMRSEIGRLYHNIITMKSSIEN